LPTAVCLRAQIWQPSRFHHRQCGFGRATLPTTHGTLPATGAWAPGFRHAATCLLLGHPVTPPPPTPRSFVIRHLSFVITAPPAKHPPAAY
jgi:hypothetical protein